MPEAWTEWVGRGIDGRYPLGHFLGSGESSGAFITDRGESDPQKAVIKLVRCNAGECLTELARYKQAAALAHANVCSVLDSGPSENPGLLYVVMEYAEENLAAVLAGR